MQILIFEPKLDTPKITKGLCNFKHKFVTAATAEPAIAALREHQIDMIIMSSDLAEPECGRFYQYVQANLQQDGLQIMQFIDCRHVSTVHTTHASLQHNN